MKLTPRSRKETARDYAVRMIRENIVSLELEPGSIVSEKELAAVMHISRTPVRDALFELSESGIVRIFPQHGSLIAKIDYDQIEEIVFFRETMEQAVVAAACDLASPEDFNFFEDNLFLQEACLARDDTIGLLELDDEFHRRLFVLTRKNRCYNIVKSHLVHFERMRRMSIASLPVAGMVADHRDIYRAVRDRDPRRARDAMHNHLYRYMIDKETLHEKFAPYIAE